MPARKAAVARPEKNKSLESWIWDAACSIRGAKRLGLADVEADIIGKSYEYLIRKFAEGGGQSAGEWSGATWTAISRPQGERGAVHQFYTPGEVGEIMACVLDPEPGMEIYDPTCGSGGLLIKCEIAMERKEGGHSCPPSSKVAA
jgi:type I restriction enzyme M protein